MTVPGADPTGLSVGEIHVWTARLVDGDRATDGQLGILCGEERARAAQFAFERDRARFIQAHGIVRRILAGYCATDPATLIFARNRHGKPALARRGNGPNLQFSISHSADCCMLALRLDHAIGVDIEKLRELPPSMDVVRSYFTAAERRALAALQGTAQRDAFFLLWTHKEAAVKALGISLAAHIGRLEFEHAPAGQFRLSAWDGDTSVAQRWSMLRLDAEPGYVAALASKHPIQSLSLRNWNRGDSSAPMLSPASINNRGLLPGIVQRLRVGSSKRGTLYRGLSYVFQQRATESIELRYTRLSPALRHAGRALA